MRKSKPILYSPPMAKATIDGKKRQTRRAVKNPEFFGCLTGDCPHGLQQLCDAYMRASSPYGVVGDLLWVREEHYRFGHWREVPGVKTKTGKQKWAFIPDEPDVLYSMSSPLYRKSRHPETPEIPRWHKRLARFMPRALSRTMLEITEIRVERLHDISNDDAMAEGIDYFYAGLFRDYLQNGDIGIDSARGSFQSLWEKINGPDSWAENPWVWVIGFKVLK